MHPIEFNLRCCRNWRRDGWPIILIAFAVKAVSITTRSLFQVVMLLMEKEFGWARQRAAALMALTQLVQGTTSPLSGLVADRIRPSVAMAGGLVYFGFAFTLAALSRSGWLVWFTYGGMCGVAYGLVDSNVIAAAIMKAVPQCRHG